MLVRNRFCYVIMVSVIKWRCRKVETIDLRRQGSSDRMVSVIKVALPY